MLRNWELSTTEHHYTLMQNNMYMRNNIAKIVFKLNEIVFILYVCVPTH